MTLLLPAIILAVCAACFWKAEAIGRQIKRADGGRLQRDAHYLSGDARAYPFAVRMGSMILGAPCLAFLIAQLVRRF